MLRDGAKQLSALSWDKQTNMREKLVFLTTGLPSREESMSYVGLLIKEERHEIQVTWKRCVKRNGDKVAKSLPLRQTSCGRNIIDMGVGGVGQTRINRKMDFCEFFYALLPQGSTVEK